MSITTGIQGPDENSRLIDPDMSQHENRIQELKTRRNTFAPISCLPTEVLCRIFLLVRDSTADWKPLLWIKVTHTSLHWRNVALTFPNLWTLLPLENAQWTEEMLKRSEMASLIVKVDASSRKFSSVANMTAALSQISRIKELQVYLNGPGATAAMQKILTILPRAAARLEVLRISARIRSHTSGTARIPSKALCETPSLRQLELYLCDFCWDSQLLSGLTHLTLHSVSSNARPTLTQLLEVLRSCPDLQVLDLKHCFPALSSQQPLVPIYLQHLRSLVLNGTLTELEPLLKNCSIQATSKIRISCRDTSGFDADFSALVSAIRSLRRENSSSSLPLARSVCLKMLAPDSVKLAFSYNALPESAFTLYHTSVDFTWTGGGAASELDAHVRRICDIHPLDDATVLSCYTSNVSSQTIADVFGRLPQLQGIYSSSQAALPILQAITMTPSPGSTTIAFPALRNLMLNDVDFVYNGPIDVDWMRDQLIERYERGFEVWELCLSNCSRLKAEDVKLFREVIVDVAWDENELGFSEDEEYNEYYDMDGFANIVYNSDSD